MSKIKLDYVQEYESAGKVYRYFRRGGVRIRLPGRPGSTEFMQAYAAAFERTKPDDVAPTGNRTVAHAARILRGTMAWANMAPSSRRGCENVLRQIERAHGHRSMVTLDRPALVRIRDSMADRPGAARNWLRVFGHLCRVAIDQGWREDNPAANVKAEYKSEPFKPWAWQDVQRFVDHHKGGKPVLALMLLLATGQRRGDVVKMGWHMVHGETIRLRQGKTGAAMAIFIRPELRALLDPLPRDAPAFLMTEHGKPFASAGFGNWFRDQCDAAGLRDLSAHGLRKLALTAAADNGATAHELQALGGHSTLAMVAHYTKAADQERLARRAVDYVLPVRIEAANAP